MGKNPVAPYETVVSYGDPVDLPSGNQTEVLFLQRDDRLVSYGEVPPLAQCFVDLFNMPSWQAARFVEWTSLQLMDSDVAA
ncbi:MAG: hypothetical protein ACYDGN_12355 [Acidimicrobiales bacterium]